MLLACLLSLALALSACAGFRSADPGNEPGWVKDPYTRYDRQTYIAAVGRGSSGEIAERDAFGRLVAIFGQRILVDETVSTYYNELITSGVAATWSGTTAINSNIVITAGIDSLMGAETGEVWDDGKGTVYAIAFLNRTRALQIYSNMIRANQVMIDRLVDIPAEDRISLESFARYQLAATVADVSTSYANVLSVIGAPPHNLRNGDYYRLEAQNISRAIPIGIRVENDRAGRIEGAFAKVLADLGFRSGGSNSRYLLDVNVATSPVTLPGNQNSFTRIEVKANLIDTNLGAVIIPFDFNIREGHITQAEADNRAYTSAERRIDAEYARVFQIIIADNRVQ